MSHLRGLFPGGGGGGTTASGAVVGGGGAGGGLAAPYGRCASCGRTGYLDENDRTCLVACDVPAKRPPTASAAPTRRPTCDCGAAAADPVSTRRDGGGGHAEWCTVRGLP